MAQDHKSNVRTEMEVLLGKLEKDLTESMVKVLVQRRVTRRRRSHAPRIPDSGRACAPRG